MKSEVRKTQHGKRVVLVIYDDEMEDEDDRLFLLFLSPSFVDPKKNSALEVLCKDKKQNFSIGLLSIKNENNLQIPKYKFFLE